MRPVFYLYVVPFALVGLGTIGYVADSEPPRPFALAMFFLAAVLPPVLGLFVAETTRRNPLKGGPGLLILTAFNLAFLSGVIGEAIALMALLDIVSPEVPTAIGIAWIFPPVMTILMATVLLERRLDSAPPTPGSFAITATILLGLGGLWLMLNAFLLDVAHIPFVTVFGFTKGADVFILNGAILTGALSMMILLRVPSLVELLLRRRLEDTPVHAYTHASPLLFSLAITGIVITILLLVGAGGQIIPRLGEAIPVAGLLRGLIFLGIVVAAFVGSLLFQWGRRTARKLYRMKMDRQRMNRIAVQCVTAILTAFLGAIAVRLATGGEIRAGGLVVGPDWSQEFIALTLLALAGPLGFYLHSVHRRVEIMEQRLSDFLSDLAQTAQAGLPLHTGLQAATTKDYGALNREIKIMARQVSWGLSFADAVARFGERVDSRLVTRASSLIVESARSGGNTAEVLTAAAREVYEIKAMDAERRVGMATYMIVVYVVFLVFLGVLLTLASTFIPQILSSFEAAQAAGQAVVPGQERVTNAAIANTFFHAAMVQAVGNGLVAGTIRENRASAGLPHVFLMVLMGFLAFQFLAL